MRMRLAAFGAVVGIGLLGLGSAPAVAGSLIFDDSVADCTGINCSSIRLPGTVGNSDPGSPQQNAEPFVLQVYSNAGQCLRLDVSVQDKDLEMVVVSPNGTVWRNDDRGPGNLKPLVAISNTPDQGWYTVQISRFNGAADYSNFVLLYGRYVSPTNPNCGTPTLPVASALGVAEESVK